MMARCRDNAIRKEDAMSHDKLKAATRRRMARTGEPYAVARRAVIQRHEEAQDGKYASKAVPSKAFEVVTAQLGKHGQEVRRQLTSANGIDEIRRRFAALQSFRDLGHSVDNRPAEVTDRGRPQWQCRRCGSDLQLSSVGHGVSSGGSGRCLHDGASW
jgi:hypothetical protein